MLWWLQSLNNSLSDEYYICINKNIGLTWWLKSVEYIVSNQQIQIVSSSIVLAVGLWSAKCWQEVECTDWVVTVTRGGVYSFTGVWGFYLLTSLAILKSCRPGSDADADLWRGEKERWARQQREKLAGWPGYCGKMKTYLRPAFVLLVCNFLFCVLVLVNFQTQFKYIFFIGFF